MMCSGGVVRLSISPSQGDDPGFKSRPEHFLVFGYFKHFDNFNDCENNDRILSKSSEKGENIGYKTTTNPSGKWVSMVKG